MAASLILLLLFEAGIGMFLGAKGIPLAVWAIVMGFGAGYLLVVSIAEALGGTGGKSGECR